MKFLRTVNKINSLNTVYEVWKVTHKELKGISIWSYDSTWDTRQAERVIGIADVNYFNFNLPFTYRKVLYTGRKLP